MSEQSKHVPEMDFLRAFAILAVIAIHVSAAGSLRLPHMEPLMVANVVISTLTGFAVPLFLFISGFVLYLKYNKKYSLKEFYQKRFWRILPPYLIFTTFYLVCEAALRVVYDTGVITFPPVIIFPSIPDVIYAYVTATGITHLWFFLIIIELYLLYPVIIKAYNLCKEHGFSLLFPIAALALRIIWGGTSFQIHLFGYDWTCILSVFMNYLVYFAAGIYVCDNYSQIKKRVLGKPIWIFISITAVYTILGSVLSLANISIPFYGSLIIPLFYLAIFAFLFGLSNKMVHAEYDFPFLRTISLYSFGIYLIHPFFHGGFIFLAGKLGLTYETAIYYPLAYIVILLASMLFVYIVRKFPFSKYIIG